MASFPRGARPIAAALAAAAVGCAGGPAAGPETAPDASQRLAGAELPEDLRERIASDMRALERWRGLRFREPVRVERQDPPHPNVGGWYDPTTKALVVASGNTASFQRGALLHELHHALQDQHFDLARMHEQAGVDPDAVAALSALIEGEAMLAVAEILDYDFEQHARLPETGAIRQARFRKIFEYGSGMRFVRHWRDARGEEFVSEIFRNPPHTSGEILHPDTYPRTPMGRPGAPDLPGVVHVDVRRGEVGVLWLLTKAEATRASAPSLASQVVVDRYREVESPAGDRTAHWLIRFRDEPGARHFEEDGRSAWEGAGWGARRDGREVLLVRALAPVKRSGEERGAGAG